MSHRILTHQRLLRNCKHSNKHLQASYDKHGLDAFEFKIILICEKENMTAYEQKLVDHYRSLPAGVFNQAGPVDSPCIGKILTREHREKLAAAGKGRKHSEESKKRMSAARKGIKPSPEHMVKLFASSIGRVVSDETRTRLSESHKGRIVSPETRAKISSTLMGQGLSPERKAKISSTLKGQIISDEVRAKISAGVKAANLKRKLKSN